MVFGYKTSSSVTTIAKPVNGVLTFNETCSGNCEMKYRIIEVRAACPICPQPLPCCLSASAPACQPACLPACLPAFLLRSGGKE
jgi:hypothetical protein